MPLSGHKAPVAEEKKQDRELIELLNELRVALPGVQVLFAFLLMVPFSQGYPKVTQPQKAGYAVALMAAAVATAFLIAPTAFHRLRFRAHDKESLLEISNRLTIVGTLALAVSIVAAVFMITDFIFGGAVTLLLTIPTAALLGILWYGLPLWRQMRD
jgi:hypothetical protein